MGDRRYNLLVIGYMQVTCNWQELFFAASLMGFILSVTVETWHAHTMLRILELRQGAMHRHIGRPFTLRKAESGEEDVTPLLFVLSSRHLVLGDAELSRLVWKLRLLLLSNLLTGVAIVVCLATAPAPKDLLRFGCWTFPSFIEARSQMDK
jgi:hypothetical protein